MTNFELNTLETLLRMFQQELEKNGEDMGLAKEEIKYYIESDANLRFLVMRKKNNPN